jgi:flavin-dependent dehydrogenase
LPDDIDTIIVMMVELSGVSLGASREMRVAIAGAGMSGSYMYRRLKDRGFKEVDLYDVKKTTACGCRPCAWGFAPTRKTREMISKVADPALFEMHRSPQVSVDGVMIRSDMLTLDKPALIRHMTEGAEIREGRIDLDDYDRVIDATGVDRAYLPRIENDVIADCTQFRIRSEEPMDLSFRTLSMGYEWCFPLGNDEYHVGFGNLKADVASYRPAMLNDVSMGSKQIRCRCRSRLRLSSPFFSQPFVTDEKIIGIGESIGAVGPLAGDGNIYALQTAELLLEHWVDLDGYAREVLRRYDWMRRERLTAEKLRDGVTPNLSEALAFKRRSNEVGMEMNTLHILRLFRKTLKR